MIPPGLLQFRASERDLREINSTFELVEKAVRLRLRGSPVVGSSFGDFGEGLYLFTLDADGARFKIYLGRTNSLSRRMREYTCTFQPHSPNDFKLQALQKYLADLLPEATLDLHFQRLSACDLKDAEAKAVKRYSPLMNRRSQASREATQTLQDAFSSYVRSTLEQRMGL